MTLPYKVALGLAVAVFALALWTRWSASPGEAEQVAEQPPPVESAPPTESIITPPKRAALGPKEETVPPPSQETAVPVAAAQEQPAEQLQPEPPTLLIGRNPFRGPSVPEESPSGPETDVADAAPGNDQPETYRIQSGDTFEKIAKRRYGSATRWVDIAQANPLIDPVRLRVGQEIRLPAAASGSRSAAGLEVLEGPDEVARKTVTHVVRSGDSLSTIASRYYGDSTLWEHVFIANRPLIGSNPNAVRVGMELKIPPSPKAAAAR